MPGTAHGVQAGDQAWSQSHARPEPGEEMSTDRVYGEEGGETWQELGQREQVLPLPPSRPPHPTPPPRPRGRPQPGAPPPRLGFHSHTGKLWTRAHPQPCTQTHAHGQTQALSCTGHRFHLSSPGLPLPPAWPWGSLFLFWDPSWDHHHLQPQAALNAFLTQDTLPCGQVLQRRTGDPSKAPKKELCLQH